MDAGIQAMEVNILVLQMLDLDDLPAHSFTSFDIQTLVITHSLPSLDAGFRHPCRNDGLQHLCITTSAGSMATT